MLALLLLKQLKKNMKLKILFAACFSIAMMSVNGQALVGGNTYPVNGTQLPPTSFGTLQQVATYLRDSGVTGTGNVIIQLQTGYNAASEPATGIVFDTIWGATASRRVIIRPANGFSASISLTVAGSGALNLSKTKYLTVDGRQGGTGPVGISITNPSTATTDSTCTVYFASDAQFNIIRYCNLSGSSKSTTLGGVVLFARGISTGNSFNTIEYCDINGMASANNGICNNGQNSSAAIQNNGDTIRFCNIYDFFNNGTAGNIGIRIHQGASNWVIHANHIYQTAPRVYTAATLNNSGINIGTSTALITDVHTVTNNFIGGSGPNCTGVLNASTASQILGYNGIVINGGVGTVVSGNTIKNISLTFSNTGGSFTNVGISSFFAFSGNISITNNTIDSFIVTNAIGGTSTGSCVVNGIQLQSSASTTSFPQITPLATIANNSITNVQANTTSSAVNAIAFGIRILSGTANSQNGLASSAFNNLTPTISGNTIQGISTNGLSASSYAYGIWGNSSLGTSSSNFTVRIIPRIENNTIRNITSSSANISLGFPAAGGISFLNMAAGINTGVYNDTAFIRNNTIFNIYGTNPAANAYNTAVTGISINLGRPWITNNKIYNIYQSAKDSALNPYISGINILGLSVPSAIMNNYISIGDTSTLNYGAFGIINSLNATTLTIAHNTVIVGGSSSNKNSAAVLRGDPITLNALTTPISLSNNLLINRRNTTGIRAAMAFPGTSAFSSNHNACITNSRFSAFYYSAFNTDLAGWIAYHGNDAYSYYAQAGVTTNFGTEPATINVSDLFTSPSFASEANMQTNTSNSASWLLFGKGLSGVATTDFSGNSRLTTSGTPVCIGANEFTTSTTPPIGATVGSISIADTTSFFFAGRSLAMIRWNSGTLPTSINCRYYSGKDHGVSAPGNKSKSYWEIVGTGGTAYNYNLFIQYGPQETGTISNGNASTKLAIFNGTGWSYLGAGATANIASNPQVASITNISNFFGASVALALTDNVSPLPVALLTLSGKQEKNNVILSWTTATELQNLGFEIEKSEDGMVFSPIGFIKGAGVSSGLIDYQFTDFNALNSGIQKLYYRLKQLDENGAYHYSNIITVSLQPTINIGLSVSPNPFSSELILATSGNTQGEANVSVSDLSGKVIFTHSQTITSDSTEIKLDQLNNLQSGVYLLTYTINGQTETRKIVKTLH